MGGRSFENAYEDRQFISIWEWPIFRIAAAAKPAHANPSLTGRGFRYLRHGISDLLGQRDRRLSFASNNLHRDDGHAD